MRDEPIPEWDNDPILRSQLTQRLEENYQMPFRVKGKNGIWPFLFSYYDHRLKAMNVLVKQPHSDSCQCNHCRFYRAEKYQILNDVLNRFEEFTGKSIDIIDLARYLEREGD